MDFDIVKPPLPQRDKRARNDPLQDYETRKYLSVYTEEIIERTEKTEPENKDLLKTDKPEPEHPDQQDLSDNSDSDSFFKELTVYEFYEHLVVRSPEQCFEELMAPQRSLTWHKAREFCITASNFGAVVGHNKYCSAQKMLLEKLWSSFKGNAFTAYGTFHEQDASESLKTILNDELNSTLIDLFEKNFPGGLFQTWALIECGIIKHYELPWMAVSPDGLLLLKGLVDGIEKSTVVVVEYKCPAGRRLSEEHPYANERYNIPEYYMDQIQGIMGLFHQKPDLLKIFDLNNENHIHTTLFVVWQPSQFHVTLVPFQKNYYESFLEPKLSDWYFKEYLPMAVLKYNELLVPGTLTTSKTIEII